MAVDSFLSYSYHDRKLAGECKGQLEGYGFDVFLAHEDIEPAREWQEEILKRLGTCEVFIALLTEAFDESNWTHQEIGIAFARNPRPIMVPINAGEGPVGFLARYQAVGLDPSRIDEPFQRFFPGSRRAGPSYMEEVALRIVESIDSQDIRLAKEIRSSLIGRVPTIGAFDDAGWLLWALAQLDGLTPDEINRLLTLASDNAQVCQSRSASEYLQQLIESHEQDIRKSALKKFYKARDQRA